MTRNEAKDLIVKKVQDHNGCKAMELCIEPDLVLSEYLIPDLIEELINEHKLSEIEFVLPHLNYRIKSFLVPIGTTVNLRNILPISSMKEQKYGI